MKTTRQIAWWLLFFALASSARGFSLSPAESPRLPGLETAAKFFSPVSTIDKNRRASSSSSLAALPPSLPWAVGHVIAGASGAPIVVQATRPKDGWYRRIDLPSWTPPDKIFGPVWTTLYAMLGVSIGRVVLQLPSSPTRTLTLVTWTIHMLFNLAWAPVFFGLQRLRLGQALNIGMLLTLLGILYPAMYRLSALTSMYLLVPYTLWLSFATCLNGSICRRNPTQGGGYNNAKFQAQLAKLQAQAKIYAGL